MYGVKGLSWLSTLPYFDTIRGFSVDYMHCVLLGVCRQLLKLHVTFGAIKYLNSNRMVVKWCWLPFEEDTFNYIMIHLSIIVTQVG